MVVDDFVGGGAFKVGERLARGLISTHTIAFACNRSSINQSAIVSLSAAGARVVGLFAHAGEPRRAICDQDSASALLARTNPDKILFVDSAPHSSIAIKDCARDLQIPYLSVVNFVDEVTPPELRQWDEDVVRAANAAACMIFVSNAAKIDFETNFPRVTATRLVVPNGVPDAFFAPGEAQARTALRRQLAIGDDEIMLLLPGRLEPRKGQHLALSALAKLRARSGPKLRLVFAGHGADEEKLALGERIAALELMDQAQYIGPRDDLPLLLDACDIVLMPSRQEADPLVSKEAMARKKPVVATDLPGVREQGHPDELRVPVPRGEPADAIAALVETIDALRRDPARRAEIGRALGEIAERRFTMAAMLDAYSQILDGAPARSRQTTMSRKREPPPEGRWLELSDPWRTSMLKDGWSDVESGGIWSLGSRSRLYIQLDGPVTSLSLQFKLAALTGPQRDRTFEVVANGRQVATWTFSSRRSDFRKLRVELPFPKRRFVIRLRDLHPASPYQLGINDDRRCLGLHLRALRLDVGPNALKPRAESLGAMVRRVARFCGALA